MQVQNGIVRMIFKIKLTKNRATVSINLHPSFKAFFKFVNVNFVSEEMVGQTGPVFDDFHKDGVF